VYREEIWVRIKRDKSKAGELEPEEAVGASPGKLK
jgi:hypothetical protein